LPPPILAVIVDVVIVYTVFSATPAAATAASSIATAAVTGFAASTIFELLYSVTVSRLRVTVAVAFAVAAHVATAADPTARIDFIPSATKASPVLA
jgi:hypothetical protein